MFTPHTAPMFSGRPSRSGRTAPSGHRLSRELSWLLVTALLLVSAITYSTQDIPNFTPDCHTHRSLKEKSRITVAIVRRSPLSPVTPLPHSIRQIPLSTPATPLQEFFSFSSPSRAPPAVTFLHA